MYLVEYDTGHTFGPASYESLKKYNDARAQGKEFFMYPYHGYELRMTVCKDPVPPPDDSRPGYEGCTCEMVHTDDCDRMNR